MCHFNRYKLAAPANHQQYQNPRYHTQITPSAASLTLLCRSACRPLAPKKHAMDTHQPNKTRAVALGTNAGQEVLTPNSLTQTTQPLWHLATSLLCQPLPLMPKDVGFRLCARRRRLCLLHEESLVGKRQFPTPSAKPTTAHTCLRRTPRGSSCSNAGRHDQHSIAYVATLPTITVHYGGQTCFNTAQPALCRVHKHSRKLPWAVSWQQAE